MLTYPDRISSMRETKRLHTLQKREQRGYSDEDDYGNIPVPEDFRFAPEPGGIYGYGGLSKAFAGMLDRYPVYVDPMEMLCGRWSKLLTDYRIGARWDEARFPYDDLKPLQKLYNITSGIDNEAHCTPDFAIGLALGFGGLLEKVRKFCQFRRVIHWNASISENFHSGQYRTIPSAVLRRQIFRQTCQKAQRILCGFASVFGA
ncbi:MAG: hypothetical protein BWY81_00317 [Firmicutes bacterium ADurb.Bin467]|nr:MAG: hypothetical protein BWY81_00317 [Firmicutes bacterium ADurb.Bin467]